MSKTINILVDERCLRVPWRDLVEFQGDLKTLTGENLEKLKQRILSIGFIQPITTWYTEGYYDILDGHQRFTALKSLESDGYVIPDVPVVRIDAESKEHAQKILLSIEAKYGELNKKALRTWLDDLDEVFDDTLRLVDTSISLDFNLFEPDTEDDDEPQKDENSKTVICCPNCGHEWDKSSK